MCRQPVVENGVELVFRKYFWTINLLFLTVAAFLVAKTVNVFTESALVAPPDANGPSTGAAPRPLFAMPTRIDAEKLSKLTGIPLPAPEVAVKEPVNAQPKDDLNSAPVHTSLHVRLLGTTVSSNPMWSFAVIEDTAAHSNDTYMVDDRVQGAKVLEILDDCSDLLHWTDPKGCVIVLNGGHREYIDDKEGNGPVANVVAPAPVVASTAPPAPDAEGVHSTGENSYTVDKSLVDKTLGNLNDVAMQARIVPAFKDGVATGFKLFSIRPDSIYAKIGIQNGDVIRRINGFEINSPEKALEAYSKLKESTRIEIEVERNGSTVRKSYDVR